MGRSENLKKRAKQLEQGAFAELWTLVAECSSILKEMSPPRRKSFLRELVDQLYREQNGRCGICGEPLGQHFKSEVDHIIPLAYAGGHERGNIQLAHTKRNREKRASVDPKELLKYLEDRYRNL